MILTEASLPSYTIPVTPHGATYQEAPLVLLPEQVCVDRAGALGVARILHGLRFNNPLLAQRRREFADQIPETGDPYVDMQLGFVRGLHQGAVQATSNMNNWKKAHAVGIKKVMDRMPDHYDAIEKWRMIEEGHRRFLAQPTGAKFFPLMPGEQVQLPQGSQAIIAKEVGQWVGWMESVGGVARVDALYSVSLILADERQWGVPMGRAILTTVAYYARVTQETGAHPVTVESLAQYI